MTILMRFSTPVTQFAQTVTLSVLIRIQKMSQQYKKNRIRDVVHYCRPNARPPRFIWLNWKMRFFLAVLVCASVGICEILHPEPSVVKVKEERGPGGLWQSKVQWKAHWVKHWEIRKLWIPVWKKVWGPVEMKEWIPFPKPPPTWAPSTWTPPPH